MKQEKTKSKKVTKKSKTKVYGFQIGKHVIDIEAKNEKEAMLILINKFWAFINDNGKIEMLGERE